MISVTEQRRLLESVFPACFTTKLRQHGQYPLRANSLEVFQMNVGRKCNLNCRHCHVDAGPGRLESMPREIFEKCLDIIMNSETITTVDITGGAPELNPHLEWFLREAAVLGKRLMVRSNLVILLEKEFEHFIDVFTSCGVEVVGSLCDYNEDIADRQRGAGNFQKCIRVLKRLNENGYGIKGSNLPLSLVHNPSGAFLPGPQAALNFEYRNRLWQNFGIEFNNVFCLTNLPVGRYLEFLQETDNFSDYVNELDRHFNHENLANVMCRSMVSVGWDGKLFDCDFNQMLNMPVTTLLAKDVYHFNEELLCTREIEHGQHCFGCTAGSGSSCQGALE